MVKKSRQNTRHPPSQSAVLIMIIARTATLKVTIRKRKLMIMDISMTISTITDMTINMSTSMTIMAMGTVMVMDMGMVTMGIVMKT